MNPTGNPTEGIGRRLQALRNHEGSVSVCQKIITYILFVILLIIIMKREKGTHKDESHVATSDENAVAIETKSNEIFKLSNMAQFKKEVDLWTVEQVNLVKSELSSDVSLDVLEDASSSPQGTNALKVPYAKGAALGVHLASLVRSHYGNSLEDSAEEAPRSFLHDTLATEARRQNIDTPSKHKEPLPRMIATSVGDGLVPDTGIAFGFDALPNGMNGMWRKVRPLYRSGHTSPITSAPNPTRDVGLVEYLDHLLAIVNGASIQTTGRTIRSVNRTLGNIGLSNDNYLIGLLGSEAFGDDLSQLVSKTSNEKPSNAHDSLVEEIADDIIKKYSQTSTTITPTGTETNMPTVADGVDFPIEAATAQLPQLKESIRNTIVRQMNETFKYAAYNEIEQSVLWRLLSVVVATSESDMDEKKLSPTEKTTSTAEKLTNVLFGENAQGKMNGGEDLPIVVRDSKMESVYDESGTIMSVLTHTVTDPRITSPWWLPFAGRDDLEPYLQESDNGGGSTTSRRKEAASEAKIARYIQRIPPIFGRRHTDTQGGVETFKKKGETRRHIETHSAARDGPSLQSALSVVRWMGFQQYVRRASSSLASATKDKKPSKNAILHPMWIMVGVPTGRGMWEFVKRAFTYHSASFGSILDKLPVSAEVLANTTVESEKKVKLLISGNEIYLSSLDMDIPKLALLSLQNKFETSKIPDEHPTRLHHTLRRSFEFPASTAADFVHLPQSNSLFGDLADEEDTEDELFEIELAKALGRATNTSSSDVRNATISKITASLEASKAFTRLINYKASLDEQISIFTKVLVYTHSLSVEKRKENAQRKRRQSHHVISTRDQGNVGSSQDDSLGNVSLFASPTFFYSPKECYAYGAEPPSEDHSGSYKDRFGASFDSQCLWIGSLSKMPQSGISTPKGVCGSNANETDPMRPCEVNAAFALLSAFWSKPPFYLSQDTHYQGLFISSCGHMVEMVFSSEAYDRFVRVTVMPYMMWYLVLTGLLSLGLGSVKMWTHNSRARILRVSPYQILFVISLQFVLNFSAEVLMQVVPATTKISRVGWLISLLNIGLCMTLFNEITAARLEQEGQGITDPSERTRMLRLGRLKSFVFLIFAISLPNSIPILLKQDVASPILLFFIPAIFWLPQLRLALTRDGGKGLSILFILSCTVVLLVPLNLFVTNNERLQLSAAAVSRENPSLQVLSMTMQDTNTGDQLASVSTGQAQNFYHTVIAPQLHFNIDDFDTFTTGFTLPSTESAYTASIWGSRILVFNAGILLILRIFNHSQLRRRLLPKWARGNVHEYQVEIIRDMKTLASLVSEDTDCIICAGSLLEDPPTGLDNSSPSSSREADDNNATHQASTPSGRGRGVVNHLHVPRSSPPSPTERRRAVNQMNDVQHMSAASGEAATSSIAIEVTTPSGDEGEQTSSNQGVRQGGFGLAPPPSLFDSEGHRGSSNPPPVKSRPPPSLWVTPCKHYFHETCLSQWMEEKMVCPLCRAPLPEP